MSITNELDVILMDLEQLQVYLDDDWGQKKIRKVLTMAVKTREDFRKSLKGWMLFFKRDRDILRCICREHKIRLVMRGDHPYLYPKKAKVTP